MNRWVKIGGAVLLLAWAPFLYAELTSSPQEKKDREIREAAEADDNALPEGDDKAEPEGEDKPEDKADPDDEAKAEPEGADKAKLAAAKAEEPEVEPESAEALAEPEGDPEAPADAPVPVRAGAVPSFKGAFDHEPRDALWAKDTEARIASILSGGDVPEGFVERAACRKAVCRVDLRWTQENAAPYLDAYEELHQAFGADIAVDPQLPPGEAPPEGGIPIHIYVMRQGYTVADLAK